LSPFRSDGSYDGEAGGFKPFLVGKDTNGELDNNSRKPRDLTKKQA
jgi:hypothetical protein